MGERGIQKYSCAIVTSRGGGYRGGHLRRWGEVPWVPVMWQQAQPQVLGIQNVCLHRALKGLSCVWVWQMDKQRPFQTEKITHGDTETRDSMAYWKLGVVGCDWWAGHLKEVWSGSWMWLGLCWAEAQRLCLGCSSTGSSCGWLPPQRSLSRSLSVKELSSPLPTHHFSFLFIYGVLFNSWSFIFVYCLYPNT